MVYLAFTSTYMATKKARKKRTPQDRVISSLSGKVVIEYKVYKGGLLSTKYPTGQGPQLT